jgi:uncharacterized protein (TIGR00290 family)
MSWSSGKDSALALHSLLHDPRFAVRALLVTVTEGYDRVSMHGVRRELLDRQARALNLPVVRVDIPQDCSNEMYEARMSAALSDPRIADVDHYAFGDLFLEDVRAYREERLGAIHKQCLFPLWGSDTATLAREFIAAGFRALVVCVDTRTLDPAFAGRCFDQDFLRDIPNAVDPCGERGEFHTFVFDGPIFSSPLAIARGEVVVREGFAFCDVMPASVPTDDAHRVAAELCR